MSYSEEILFKTSGPKRFLHIFWMCIFSKRVGFKTLKTSISHFRPLCSHFHIFPENLLTETFLHPSASAFPPFYRRVV
jgi:hypothetical protein